MAKSKAQQLLTNTQNQIKKLQARLMARRGSHVPVKSKVSTVLATKLSRTQAQAKFALIRKAPKFKPFTRFVRATRKFIKHEMDETMTAVGAFRMFGEAVQHAAEERNRFGADISFSRRAAKLALRGVFSAADDILSEANQETRRRKQTRVSASVVKGQIYAFIRYNPKIHGLEAAYRAVAAEVGPYTPTKIVRKK